MQSLIMQLGDWLHWIGANWVALFAMVSVAAMAAVFLVLGLTSSMPDEHDRADDPLENRSGEGPTVPPEAR